MFPALSEMDSAEAGAELKHAAPALERTASVLWGQRSTHGAATNWRPGR